MENKPAAGQHQAPSQPASRRAKAAPKPTRGTRVGNGWVLLEGVDPRSWGARRFGEIVADHFAHLGGDVTAPQEAIIRRAAQLQVWCEQEEAAFANGADFDIAAFTTASNALRRLMADLGFERKAKDITPNLSEYLSRRETVA